MKPIRCDIMRKQLMVEPRRIAPCCNFSKTLPIENYHELVEGYAEQLDQGIKIPECKLCWDTEAAGLVSVRQSGNEASHTFQGDGITYLDIRLDNKCNLACNMCGTTVSTLWGKLENKESPDPLNNDLVKNIMDKTGDLKRISLQGGEPFYGEKYIDFVDSLANKSSIDLDVFSNVVTIDMKIIKRWTTELKSLTINASVDGYGDVYDYIRWPTTWRKFSTNAIKLHNITDLRLGYFFTIQANNVLSIKDFIQWRNQFTPLRPIVFTNVIHKDEVTYKGLDQAERDAFLSSEDQILEMLSVNERERSDMTSFFSLVKNTMVDDELVEKRKKFNSYIDTLRNAYVSKSSVQAT